MLHPGGTTIQTNSAACQTQTTGAARASAPKSAIPGRQQLTSSRDVPSFPFRDVSLEQFQMYQKRNAPVVLRGAAASWGAADWSLEWFKSGPYRNVEVEVSVDGLQDGVKQKMTIADYIESFDGLANSNEQQIGSPASATSYIPYLRAWYFGDSHPELLDAIPLAASEKGQAAAEKAHLGGFFVDKLKRLPKHVRPPLTWIFMGAAGCVSKLHVDVWHTSAWFAQIEGRKHFTFFPPEHTRLVHNATHGWADPSLKGANCATHKYYAAAQPYEVTLGPGDLLFIPSKWPHQVMHQSPQSFMKRAFRLWLAW
eukprot:SAG31_NODE_154_length_22184_cov_25.917142_3_plen_311_part_00